MTGLVGRRKWTAAPDSMTARFFLAFLSTAGLYYVNIMPAIVDGLIEGLGFTAREAGMVASANVYGAAAGALLIVCLIRNIRWRVLSYSLLACLIGIDLLSMLLRSPEAMIAFRFLHGFVGGALVGTGFSVIARTVHPDRTFGVLLFIQFGLGGLGNLYIPRLVPAFGTNVLFLALIAFSAITLLMVPFLDRYEVTGRQRASHDVRMDRSLVLPLVLVVLSIFLFQAANNGVFAFIIGLGKSAGLSLDFITMTLAASGWVGILGALFVIAIYTRFGRAAPLAVAMTVTVAATWALLFSGNDIVFLAANCMLGMSWAFVMAYLLGLAAQFDISGQMAALGGFASKMGLASGPLAGALLLGDDDYAFLINLAIFALILAALASVIPAVVQDRATRRMAVPENAVESAG